MSGLRVSTHREEPFTVLELDGDLDDVNAPTGEAHILTAVVAGPAPVHLVIDLSKVGFLTSAGVNLIAKTHFVVKASRGSIRLVVPEDGSPHRVLKFTGITEAIATYPRRELALAEPPAPPRTLDGLGPDNEGWSEA